jgi:uncharacterized membrane protein YcaP (DUF421 family)
MPDWHAMFVPQGSLVELFLRGTLMYLAIFFAFRFFRRGAGGLGVADLLLVVLVADAAQNGMAGDYRSVPEGLVLVGTIVFWDFAIDCSSFTCRHFARCSRERPPRSSRTAGFSAAIFAAS